MSDFGDIFPIGTSADYMGQIGGYDIGPQPIQMPDVSTAVPEYTQTAATYAPEMTFQTPTEMPTFASYDPTFAFKPDTTPATTAYAAPQTMFAGPVSQPSTPSDLQSAYAAAAKPLPDVISQYAGPAGAAPTGGLYAAPEAGGTDKGPLDALLGKMSGGDIVKLLTGGVGGLMSYMSAQKAQQQAQQAADEYRKAAQAAAQQYRQVAQPYLTAGAPQLSMALQGTLSPAQMQLYQAGQARLAQAAAKTGGVGAIQTTAAEQAMYQQALQNQQQMALQLLGQADPLLTEAIRTELLGTQGALDFELRYGAQAATALGQMMASLGGTVGRTA